MSIKRDHETLILLKPGHRYMGKISPFFVFGNFHYAIFFQSAPRWVRKLCTAEGPGCEPLAGAAATAPINRKFMNLYSSPAPRPSCMEQEGSLGCPEETPGAMKCRLAGLCSPHKPIPDATLASLSLSMWLTEYQTHIVSCSSLDLQLQCPADHNIRFLSDQFMFI